MGNINAYWNGFVKERLEMGDVLSGSEKEAFLGLFPGWMAGLGGLSSISFLFLVYGFIYIFTLFVCVCVFFGVFLGVFCQLLSSHM